MAANPSLTRTVNSHSETTMVADFALENFETLENPVVRRNSVQSTNTSKEASSA